MNKESAAGAVLGMAVGDALGTTYEFDVIAQPAFPTLATGPATDVVGAGPFLLAPGAVTDDTQLGVCVARSLVAHRGELDLADVSRRFLAWSVEAFDVGNQTRAALQRLADGEDPREAGRRVWRASGRRAAGNGSLMRAAPLAVAYAGRPRPARVEAAVAESLITHADPRCALACAAFVEAIATAVAGETRTGDFVDATFMIDAAADGSARAAALLREAWASDADDLAAVTDAEIAIASDFAAAAAPDPELYGAELHIDRAAGFVRVAFRLAFWHLRHTPRWTAALVDVASRGGDSDTNAAIAGALLGARDGAPAIPQAWRDRVLAATLPGSAAWAAAHHPRHLLALIG